LHVNDDGLPATGTPAAKLAGNPNYNYKANDPAYGYNYLVTPNLVANDSSTIVHSNGITTQSLRSFSGIAYNSTGNASLDTVNFVRLDGTDRSNRFTVVPDTKKVTTFLVDGNMPDTSCRKDGGDYLNLDTTHMGAPGSNAVYSRTLHIFTQPNTFAGTIDGKNYYPDLPAAGAGDYNGQTVPPVPYIPPAPGVDSGELSSPTGNGWWGFTRKGVTYAKPVYFLSMEQFNHVAIVADVTVPQPNSNQAPQVIVKDAETGDVKFTVQPFESYFHGGINVAVGDLNCDGIPDLAVAPQEGHTPIIKLYDGSPDAQGVYEHKLINSFNGFDPKGVNQTFLGGLSIAIGDVNYDGHNDLIVGFGPGYLPTVQVFNGETLKNKLPSLLGTPFPAFSGSYGETINLNFKGGVTVAAGDLNNDGYAEIIATPASNGPPIVNVFNGNGYKFMRGFYAFPSSAVPNGLSLAVGDINGDGVRDIVVGSSLGNAPTIYVFSGATLFTAPTVKPLLSKSVAPPYFRGSILVMTAPIDGGDPTVVSQCAIFAELFPVVLNGGVATPIYLTITPFNQGPGGK
jgi:hypothetical protein